MLYSLVVLFATQPPATDEPFVGRVERVNRADSSVAVRDRGFGARSTFYVGPTSQVTKDGVPASLPDVKAEDFVSLTWNNAGGTKRWVSTLDVRPTLQLAKLKVGAAGFLPPQSDLYYFEVEAVVDSRTVLVREVLPRAAPAPPIGRGRARGVAPAVVHARGELFMVGDVEANDYVPGKRIALDGRYVVARTGKAAVTKETDKVTVKTERSSTSQAQVEGSARVTNKGRANVQAGGGSGRANIESRGEAEVEAKETAAGNSRSSTSSQRAVTREVTAFVLTPVGKSRP